MNKVKKSRCLKPLYEKWKNMMKDLEEKSFLSQSTSESKSCDPKVTCK